MKQSHIQQAELCCRRRLKSDGGNRARRISRRQLQFRKRLWSRVIALEILPRAVLAFGLRLLTLQVQVISRASRALSRVGIRTLIFRLLQL